MINFKLVSTGAPVRWSVPNFFLSATLQSIEPANQYAPHSTSDLHSCCDYTTRTRRHKQAADDEHTRRQQRRSTTAATATAASSVPHHLLFPPPHTASCSRRSNSFQLYGRRVARRVRVDAHAAGGVTRRRGPWSIPPPSRIEKPVRVGRAAHAGSGARTKEVGGAPVQSDTRQSTKHTARADPLARRGGCRCGSCCGCVCGGSGSCRVQCRFLRRGQCCRRRRCSGAATPLQPPMSRPLDRRPLERHHRQLLPRATGAFTRPSSWTRRRRCRRDEQ